MMEDNYTVLPDGSAFSVLSMALPEDHWIYGKGKNNGPPPMLLRMGEGEPRQRIAHAVREAAKYAVRASTRCGKDNDFDPDALVQNMVVGLLGYHTTDGADPDGPRYNPNPLPPLFEPPA